MGDKDVLREEEVQKLFKEVNGSESMQEESAISWDGSNLIVRIPREIADYLKINKDNRFQKNFKFIIEEVDGSIIKRFEIVERSKPKKKNAKTNKSSKKNNKS